MELLRIGRGTVGRAVIKEIGRNRISVKKEKLYYGYVAIRKEVRSEEKKGIKKNWVKKAVERFGHWGGRDVLEEIEYGKCEKKIERKLRGQAEEV